MNTVARKNYEETLRSFGKVLALAEVVTLMGSGKRLPPQIICNYYERPALNFNTIVNNYFEKNLSKLSPAARDVAENMMNEYVGEIESTAFDTKSVTSLEDQIFTIFGRRQNIRKIKEELNV